MYALEHVSFEELYVEIQNFRVREECEVCRDMVPRHEERRRTVYVCEW